MSTELLMTSIWHMLIASLFIAQSTFAMNAEVQEALAPDTISVIFAPVLAFDYVSDASMVVTPG